MPTKQNAARSSNAAARNGRPAVGRKKSELISALRDS